MTRMVAKAKSKWDDLNNGTQKLVTIITSIGVIVGAFIGASNYIVGQLDAHIQGQMSDLKSDVAEVKLSSTRNELILMIEHNPKNVIEIERLAKVYFVDMNGDFYMTSLYSDWCRQQKANCSFLNVE